MENSNKNGNLSGDSEQTSEPEKEMRWTISKMAEEFGVSYRTLRFYQQKGLLSPERRGNARLYTRRDYVHMKIITVARNIGLPLIEVREILEAYHQAEGGGIQTKLALERLNRHLVQLQEQKNLLTGQVEETRRVILERESSLKD